MDEEKNRWSDFSLEELLVLSVLSRDLNSEIDRRYLQRAEEAKANTGASRLTEAQDRVDGSEFSACTFGSDYASKNEVKELRRAVRSLIDHLAGEERSS